MSIAHSPKPEEYRRWSLPEVVAAVLTLVAVVFGLVDFLTKVN
jgi:hypothetical protein